MNKHYLYESFRYYLSMFFKFRVKVFFSFFAELAFPVGVNAFFIAGMIEGSPLKLSVVELIRHVVISNIIFMISVTDLDNKIAKDIKDFKLIYKLLSPIDPWTEYITSDIASKFGCFLVFYLPMIFILAFVGGVSLWNIFMIILFLLISSMLGYCITFIIGCMAFWLTEIWGISAIKSLVLAVFSGSTFPFSILPEYVRKVLLYFPFPYISYVPTSILTNSFDNTTLRKLLFIGFFWSGILLVLASLIWKIGLKKYEGNGA